MIIACSWFTFSVASRTVYMISGGNINCILNDPLTCSLQSCMNGYQEE